MKIRSVIIGSARGLRPWAVPARVTPSVMVVTAFLALACGPDEAAQPEPDGSPIPQDAQQIAASAGPATKIDVSGAKIDGQKLVVGDLSADIDPEYIPFDIPEDPPTLQLWPDQNAVIVRGMNTDDITAAIVFQARDGYLYEVGRDWIPTSAVVNGTNLVVDTGNCGQTYHEIWTIQGQMYTQVSKETAGTFDETKCAACPFVDVLRDGEWVESGEILRNVRSKEQETTQGLDLASHGDTLTLRIAERKHETTYADAVWVEIGGQAFAPTACGSLCAIDGNYETLSNGDSVELTWTGLPSGHAKVMAHGWYLPDTVQSPASAAR